VALYSAIGQLLAICWPVTLGASGELEFIAGAVAFPASNDAAWITGHSLAVDGGLIAISQAT
jgi:NAD(P)-dependent dehydrogenase (short-subunit alcohol dehydrogenase family)